MISARTETSSAEVGSSSTSTSGSTASARAIATRWACPPESSWGYLAREATGETHHGEQLCDALRFLTLMQPVHVKNLFQGALHGESRVERREGVLKDKLDLSRERSIVAALAHSHGLTINVERSGRR